MFILCLIQGSDSLFTLSALECWGQKDDTRPIFRRPNVLSKACVPAETPSIPLGPTENSRLYINATSTIPMTIRTAALYLSPTSSSNSVAAHESYSPAKTKDSGTEIPNENTNGVEIGGLSIDDEKDDIVLSATAIVLIACASFIFICITIVCVYARRWDDLPIDSSDDSCDTHVHKPVPHLQKTKSDSSHKPNGQTHANGHVKTVQTCKGCNGPVLGNLAKETAIIYPNCQVPNGHFTTGVYYASDTTGTVRESEENGNNVADVESYWV